VGLGFRKSYTDEVREQVDEMFGKKYKFQSERWRLPEPSALFREEPFKVPKLLDLKKCLNSTKSKLDNKEIVSWHKHTTFTNRAGLIVSSLRKEFQPEMCTQAWAKFHEILSSFNIVPQSASRLNSVHLCEAPGAFIASLNHYLKTHRVDCTWQWKAMTLNPYFEGNDLVALIDQDKFMSETWGQWYQGVDNSGDITLWENVEGLIEVVRRELGEVHLVTADGGINCVDNPGEQEEISAQLLLCEVVTALLLLRAKGTLILKTFTTLEHKTLCLMYLLACCFAEVTLKQPVLFTSAWYTVVYCLHLQHTPASNPSNEVNYPLPLSDYSHPPLLQLHVVKPATSKAGNSEQYVICLGYNGAHTLSQKLMERLKLVFGPHPPPRAMFPSSSIPESFLVQLIECTSMFAQYQMNVIEENMKLYDCMTYSQKRFILDVSVDETNLILTLEWDH